jgi:hypothetical protein
MSGAGARLTRRVTLGAGFALAVAPQAFAHRSQSVLTTVTWNAVSSMLEVTHRLHSDDAELGLAQATGAASMDLTVVKNQAQLMLYVESHFALMDGTAKIALAPLGAEFEGQSILLYQEAKRPAPPKDLVIDNRILRDVFDGQTNLVNVRLAQRTRTLIFSGNDGTKKVEGLL